MPAYPTILEFDIPVSQSIETRFAAFVATHRERAVRTAWRLTGSDRSTAEEVAQDAFLRAHNALHRFRDEASLNTWFYRILVRQAANHRRWRGVRDRFARTKGHFVHHNSMPNHADPALRKHINDAVEQLSQKQRSVFVLVYLEGFTLDETADIVGCAGGTARSHLHRALKHLRHELAPLHEESKS